MGQDQGKREDAPMCRGSFWVKCRGFRCLAVRDPQGRWLSYFGGRPLDEVTDILPLSTD